MKGNYLSKEFQMKRIVVATQNKGKVEEIKKMLGDLPVEVKTMGEVGIDIEVD